MKGRGEHAARVPRGAPAPHFRVDREHLHDRAASELGTDRTDRRRCAKVKRSAQGRHAGSGHHRGLDEVLDEGPRGADAEASAEPASVPPGVPGSCVRAATALAHRGVLGGRAQPVGWAKSASIRVGSADQKRRSELSTGLEARLPPRTMPRVVRDGRRASRVELGPRRVRRRRADLCIFTPQS